MSYLRSAARPSVFSLAVVLCFLMPPPHAVADELLFPNADFELGTLEGWTAEGGAFSAQPTQGDNSTARNREPSNHQGEYWIGTYERCDGQSTKPGATQGDRPTGTLTSEVFTVKKPYITFLVGGGHLPTQAGVKLVSGDQELFLSSGFDSESMTEVSTDVSKFIGQECQLVIFDQASAGWGHINVDAFRATDQPTDADKNAFSFTGKISPVAYPETGYDQPLRPQFHFSSRKNWLNDPNGMVYDGQQYHLFFQHNPKAAKWGNMTWGHATSPDMLHWSQKDHALLPYRVDGRSGTIFSGTAVVDHNNSLGKQQGDVPTLVAFYTFANKPRYYQAMAYSTDCGDSWTYWDEGRAVVENQGFDTGERDPKVFWHEASQQWVMVLWVSRKPGRVRFFTSTNLTDWAVASDLMRDWAFECMDLVFLPVDGDANNTKCVIYDASFDYEIGTFDGQQFTSESGPQKMGGGNFYAAQTFNQHPQDRAVQIGWMRGGPNSAELHGLPYNQQMAFPYELTLRQTSEGTRLFAEPIAEIADLVETSQTKENVTLGEGDDLLADAGELDLIDFSITFDPGTAEQLIFDFPHVTLTYDTAKQTLIQSGVTDKGESRSYTLFKNLSPRDGIVKLRFLIDRLSVESFAFDGEDFRAQYYSPQGSDGAQSITAIGGRAEVKQMTLNQLRSIW